MPGMPEYPTDWDFYITFRDDKLASVMVNLALEDVAPIEDLPECVTIRVPLRLPNEQGLSTAEERPQMDEIEDALRDALRTDDGRLFAGRRIVDGQFELVFFAAEESETDGVVARVMSRFPGYDAETSAAADPEWDVYRRDLFPNQVELRQILNQRRLRELEARGDDPARERPVRHTLGFPNALARADFAAAIEGRGFEVTDVDADDDAVPFELRLVRRDAIDHGSINEVTIELLLLAEQYEGEYLGWAADVAQ